MQLRSSTGSILYGVVVISDTPEIEDEIYFGGMLYILKKLRIHDGKEYQIDNAGNILMYRDVYTNCNHILEKFGERAVNPQPSKIV